MYNFWREYGVSTSIEEAALSAWLFHVVPTSSNTLLTAYSACSEVNQSYSTKACNKFALE